MALTATLRDLREGKYHFIFRISSSYFAAFGDEEYSLSRT
jgi:hypothetical protein